MIYTSPEELLRIFGAEHPLGVCCRRLADPAGLPEGETLLPGGIRAISKPEDPLKTEGRYEAHRKYTDVQLVLRGTELVKTAPMSACSVLEAYDPEADIEWLSSREEYPLLLAPGRLLVLFPSDAHMPSLIPAGGCRRVHKVIFKVPVF